MKDSYGKRIYKCKCGSNEEQFVWESELAKFKFSCSKCKKEIKFVQLIINKIGQSASIRTPTKNR